jgi:hypothetical protein
LSSVARRICSLGVAGFVIGGVLGGTAVASASGAPRAVSTPEVFAGSAAATALKLSVLGINLTASQTAASADSSPKAHANAAALTGSATISPTVADAPVAGNLSFTTAQPCNFNTPIQGVLSATGSCSQSAAAVPPAAAPSVCPGAGLIAPTACSQAGSLNLDVQLVQALQPILDELKTAVAPLDQSIGQVLTNLPVVTPLLQGLLSSPVLSGLNLNLGSPVGSLLTAVERATELAGIKVLPSSSQVATSAGALTAASDSSGVVVTVLPNLTTSGHPLLSIVLGTSATVSTFNRSTCQSTSTFTAAGATLQVLDNPVQRLGTGVTTLPLGLGTITIGGGTTTQNPDGSVGSVADGLNINLLNGAIVLNAAHSESVAGGKCAVLVVTPTIAATTTTLRPVTGTLPVRLATTGSSAPVLPIGMALVVVGYLTRRVVRRRRGDPAAR